MEVEEEEEGVMCVCFEGKRGGKRQGRVLAAEVQRSRVYQSTTDRTL